MIKVIYEDNHLLVLNKPSGLLTQPTKLNSDSLETRAKKWLKKKYQKKGNVFLEAIHRIDRPTSGIVVFAKTSKALSRLMLLLFQKTLVDQNLPAFIIVSSEKKKTRPY